MIRSMTGYGEVQHTDDVVSYLLELRSVNSRYFKALIKLPDHLTVFEADVERLLRGRLSRGTVSYNLRVRHAGAGITPEINTSVLASYLQQLRPFTQEAQARIDLAALLALPGVCQPPEIDEQERERQWEVISTVTTKALDKLIEMRQVEGRSLCTDLAKQCDTIREHLATVTQRAPGVLREYHQRLLMRANDLLKDGPVPLKLDDVRREIALYAERCDINEEIARLTVHLEQFARLCTDSEQAGRKLDFLAQELLREANTIGSKSNDTEIAHHIVEIKGAIDRLKEQVQNVE